MNITIKFGRITREGLAVLATKEWLTEIDSKEEPKPEPESENAHAPADVSANREEG